MVCGNLIPAKGEIEINAGLPTVSLTVSDTGDRPVQVGSHYHFLEVNPGRSFKRKTACAMRLAVLARTAVRFEPGQTRDVTLVSYGGIA